MFPENRLSTTLVAGDYLYPYNLKPPSPLVAYAQGGINISDASLGLRVQLWTAYVSAGSVVLLAPSLSGPVAVMDATGVTELTLAFDQNMNYCLAFMQLGTARLLWYNTLVNDYVVTEFPLAISPRVTLDDKRTLQTTASDIILAYTKNNNLYMRLQRDRFTIEYLLRAAVNATLVQMGMNNKNRLQFKLDPINQG